MFILRFIIQILHYIQNVQKGQRHQIQICEVTNLSAPAAFVFVPSVFGEKFPADKF
jgi:hypothetical protein